MAIATGVMLFGASVAASGPVDAASADGSAALSSQQVFTSPSPVEAPSATKPVSFRDVPATAPNVGPIDALAALGVVKGVNANETRFDPSGVVTRAQLVKVVDVVTGLKAAAYSLITSRTRFKDVPPGRWFTGYVAIAADRGYVKGYGNGRFGPNDPITYAEALAVLVRALGYRAAVHGGYPAGYVAEAGALGLLRGMSIDSSAAPMMRGEMARLLWNALLTRTGRLAPVRRGVVVASPTGQYLLTAMGYTGYWTGASLGSAAAGAGNVLYGGLDGSAMGGALSFARVLDIGGVGYRMEHKYAVVGASSLRDLVGRQVNFIVNSRTGRVAVVIDATPSRDVLHGTVSSANAVSLSLGGVGTEEFATGNQDGALVVHSTTMSPDGVPETSVGGFQGPYLDVGGYAVGVGSAAADLRAGDAVTAVLNSSGRVVSVLDPHASVTVAGAAGVIVQHPSDSSDMLVLSGAATDYSTHGYLLYGPGETPARVTLDGKPAGIGSLKPGMIVQIRVKPGSTGLATSVAASDASVTGELSSLGYADGREALTIGGKSYPASSAPLFLPMPPGAGGISGISSITPASPSTLASLVGMGVTAWLDASGRVAMIMMTPGQFETAAYQSGSPASGVVTVVPPGGGPQSYTLAPGAVQGTAMPFYPGQLVNLNLNAGQAVTKITQNAGAVTELNPVTATDASVLHLPPNIIEVGGVRYYVLPNASAYNVVPGPGGKLVTSMSIPELLKALQTPATVVWIDQTGYVISGIEVAGAATPAPGPELALVTGISGAVGGAALMIDAAGVTSVVRATASGIPSVIPSVDVLSENSDGVVDKISPATASTFPGLSVVSGATKGNAGNGTFTNGTNLVYDGMQLGFRYAGSVRDTGSFTGTWISGSKSSGPGRGFDVLYDTVAVEVPPTTVFWDEQFHTTAITLGELPAGVGVVVFGQEIGNTGTYVADYVIITGKLAWNPASPGSRG